MQADFPVRLVNNSYFIMIIEIIFRCYPFVTQLITAVLFMRCCRVNVFARYIVGISGEAFCLSFKQEYIYNMNGLLKKRAKMI